MEDCENSNLSKYAFRACSLLSFKYMMLSSQSQMTNYVLNLPLNHLYGLFEPYAHMQVCTVYFSVTQYNCSHTGKKLLLGIN